MSELDRALNQIVSEQDPVHIGAVNICGLIQGLIRATVDYADRFEEQKKEWLIDGNDGLMAEFYDFTKEEISGMTQLSHSILTQLKSASKDVTAKLFSQFVDEMIDYRHCVAALQHCFTTISLEAPQKRLQRNVAGIVSLQGALAHYYSKNMVQ